VVYTEFHWSSHFDGACLAHLEMVIKNERGRVDRGWRWKFGVDCCLGSDRAKVMSMKDCQLPTLCNTHIGT